MTQIKICGVTSEAVFRAVAEAGAEYVGFNFFEPSPRCVTPQRAASLSATYQGGPLRVGLFVQPSLSAIEAVLQTVSLDILQIYGSSAFCRQMREATGVRTWRAVGVAAAGDLPGSAEGLDGFVIEAKAPAGATRPGGNATVMDWRLLKGWNISVPWLLAGGLNPANVAPAIAETGAPGVDVSSGVETAPGEKSAALVRDFIAAVRRGL